VTNCPFVSLIKEWLLCVPPLSTSRFPQFCPHSVFMCFVWISDQTTIISRYNINVLVSKSRGDAEFLIVIQINLSP